MRRAFTGGARALVWVDSLSLLPLTLTNAYALARVPLPQLSPHGTPAHQALARLAPARPGPPRTAQSVQTEPTCSPSSLAPHSTPTPTPIHSTQTQVLRSTKAYAHCDCSSHADLPLALKNAFLEMDVKVRLDKD